MANRCGAKTRAGGTCANPPVTGRTRCRMHGGKTPKGQQNALKHGIYSAGLREGEQEIWDSVTLGSIDEELRLCRIRLRRALIAQGKVDADPNNPGNLEGFELHEITRTVGSPRSDGKGPQKPGLQTTSKRADYNAIIDRLIGRIESLERTRLELLKNAEDDTPEAITINIRRAKKTDAEES